MTTIEKRIEEILKDFDNNFCHKNSDGEEELIATNTDVTFLLRRFIKERTATLYHQLLSEEHNHSLKGDLAEPGDMVRLCSCGVIVVDVKRQRELLATINKEGEGLEGLMKKSLLISLATAIVFCLGMLWGAFIYSMK